MCHASVSGIVHMDKDTSIYIGSCIFGYRFHQKLLLFCHKFLGQIGGRSQHKVSNLGGHLVVDPLPSQLVALGLLREELTLLES